jgi:TPR repeat protein
MGARFASGSATAGELHHVQGHDPELKVAMPLAKAGDPVAQEMIGELYDGGIEVKRDYGTALAWYRRAAAQGNAMAETRLTETAFIWRRIAHRPKFGCVRQQNKDMVRLSMNSVV